MQAESIGGFCFIEQFPWDLLTEVLRGCREYSFRGAKICEFTPIDPYLSEPVWEMIENNRLPDGWGVFRANTECAKEAGHVSAEWFEEFFGMVPEEMLLTRLIGARASYEGSVYQGFNSKIHVAGEEAFEFPLGAHHRRSIDWGFGIENAFVCLWGYKIGSGIWFIYDEYYSTDQSKTILDHLESIGERHEWPRDSFHGTTWADPSDPGSIRLAQAAGFPVTPARNAVHEGIDYVRYLLKTIPGIGKPRLIIHGKNCPNLVRQMKTYRYQRGPTTGNNPRDGKPEPLKKDDHAVDALRYMVFSEHQHSGLSQSTSPRDFKPERFGIHTDFNGRGLLSGFANRRVE